MLFASSQYVFRASAIAIAIATGIGAPSGTALAGTLPTEDAFFSELPVVLSGSRLSQPLRDAPGSMTVIDRDTISRTGARDLADVMRWVPGFQVAQGTNTYSAPVAVYHGGWTGSATALQVLVDGRTLYSPLWFGGINFDALPIALKDIERIEVFRGSNSATFGANALSGVINIVTTEPTLARGGAVSVSGGTQGVADVYARIAGGSADFDQRLSLSRQSDSGLGWFRDSRRTNRFDWRGDWRLTQADELRFMASGADSHVQLGLDVPGWEPERLRKLSALHFQADWTHRLASGDTVSLRYFRVSESMRDRYPFDLGIPRSLLYPAATGTVGYPVIYDADTDRDDIEFQHVLQIDPAKRVVWGLNWRRDALRSETLFAAPVNVSTRRIFGHFEWRPHEQWLLNVGGTWEDESLAGNMFSPRMTMSFRLSNEQTLRFGAARAHRTPSAVEQKIRGLFSDPALPAAFSPLMVGYKAEGGLKPERLDSLEIGYLGEFRSAGLTVDARLFDERMKNRVVSYYRQLPATDCFLCAFPPGVWSLNFANGQDVRTRGIEYQLRWQTPWSAQVWFNQSFINAKSDRLIPMSPEWSAMLIEYVANSVPRRAESIHWMQNLPWLGANLTVSYSHTTPVQWFHNANSSERIDLRLAVPFKGPFGSGEVEWVSRAANGPIREYDNGPARHLQQTIDPRHWIGVRLDF